MFEPEPIIRPIFQNTDTDPTARYAVWFMLAEVDGTYQTKTGMSKSFSWLRNHLEVANSDRDLVVPIHLTREEYETYFAPHAPSKPDEGRSEFLRKRYEEQRPEVVTYGQARQAKGVIQMRPRADWPVNAVSEQRFVVVDQKDQ